MAATDLENLRYHIILYHLLSSLFKGVGGDSTRGIGMLVALHRFYAI